MSKHTKGPWKIQGDHHPEYVVGKFNDNGFVVCARAYGAFRGEIEANAQLIAAAPEMLKALKYVKRCKLYGPADQARELIDAAIKKAEAK